MKKKFFSIMLTTLLVTFVACAPQNGTPPIVDENGADIEQEVETQLKVSDFFPFEENIYRKYTGTGSEYAEYETRVEYLKNDALQIKTSNPGTDSVSVYIIEDNALKRVYFEGEAYSPQDHTTSRNRNEIIIKEPIERNTTWALEDGSTRTITATNVDIEVPYGNFKALEITTSRETSTTKDYYVKDLGLVKTEFISKEDPTFIVTSKLEAFEK